MKLITLLTDFTDADGYVGVMKGVILSIDPHIRIVDLCHSIPPQDVMQAARLLGRSAPFFPAGTVHIAVVDPGVGTKRRAVIARLGEQVFVGPDNGLMTLLYQHSRENGETVEIFELHNRAYQLPAVSRTFHGRDVFAPAGAHYLAGAALPAFGRLVDDPYLLELPRPIRIEKGWQGQIIHVDAFGNLASNIHAQNVKNHADAHIIIKNYEIQGIKLTFGEGMPGELIAIIDSSGYLSICVVNGSAARLLDAGAGATIRVDYLPG